MFRKVLLGELADRQEPVLYHNVVSAAPAAMRLVAPTFVCNLVLEPPKTLNSQFCGARHKPSPQDIAVDGLWSSLPVHCHVVSATWNSSSAMRGCWRGVCCGCKSSDARRRIVWPALDSFNDIVSGAPFPRYSTWTAALCNSSPHPEHLAPPYMRSISTCVLSNLDLAKDQAPIYSIRKPA